ATSSPASPGACWPRGCRPTARCAPPCTCMGWPATSSPPSGARRVSSRATWPLRSPPPSRARARPGPPPPPPPLTPHRPHPAAPAASAARRCASDGPEAPRPLGTRLGQQAVPGDVIALYGELGAGKTCLIQGVAAGLGVTATVTSPTFILIAEYAGRLPLHHV